MCLASGLLYHCLHAFACSQNAKKSDVPKRTHVTHNYDQVKYLSYVSISAVPLQRRKRFPCFIINEKTFIVYEEKNQTLIPSQWNLIRLN